MSLSAYFEKWALSQPVQIAATPTSDVYRAIQNEAHVVLKIFTQTDVAREVRAAQALKYFDGFGSVRLLASDLGAHLLEFVDGRDLRELSVNGRDEEATVIACENFQKLHTDTIVREIPKLISMRENFRALFDDRLLKDADPIYFEGRRTAAMLIETEREARVLHGDLHHQNIIESSDRGWIAIDPHGVYGERTYDLANLFFNPDDIPSLVETEDRVLQMATAFADRLKIGRQRILEFAFAYGALSSAWSIQDGRDPSRRLRISRIIQKALSQPE